MNIKKGRGYVYSLEYHIVWCVKYRQEILFGKLKDDLIEILFEIAKKNGFEILEINSDKDYIHLLVSLSPQHYIPSVIKALKGVSARLIFKEYREELTDKLWSKNLWNPSYFVATVSENTKSQIEEYIKSQGKRNV